MVRICAEGKMGAGTEPFIELQEACAVLSDPGIAGVKSRWPEVVRIGRYPDNINMLKQGSYNRNWTRSVIILLALLPRNPGAQEAVPM